MSSNIYQITNLARTIWSDGLLLVIEVLLVGGGGEGITTAQTLMSSYGSKKGSVLKKFKALRARQMSRI